MFNFFKRGQNDPKKELKALLGDFDLPSFPAVVMEVLSKLRDPDSSLNDIASQIEIDPGMNIKILQLVNSAAFGLSTKVSNLHHAVTMLGRSRLESLLLTYAVATTVPTKMICMNDSLFWLVSARRACLARRIALLLHPTTQSESFTAALLQDMAIPLISDVKKQSYKELLDKWNTEKEVDIDKMERDIFGYDHPSVGALVAQEWSLPEFLINSIAGHHDLSEQSAAEPAVRLVSLLRYSTEDDDTERLFETAQNNFGIGKPVLEEIVVKAFDEAEQFAATFK